MTEPTYRKVWKFTRRDIEIVTGYPIHKINYDIRQKTLDPSSLLSLWRYITKARVDEL